MASPGVLDDPPRRWGLLDVLGWFLLAQIGSGLWATLILGPLAGPLKAGSFESPTVAGMFFGAFVLWFAYGLGPVITTRSRGRGPVADLGTKIRAADLPLGLAFGVFLQWPVLTALYFPILRFVDGDPSGEARELADRASGLPNAVLLVILAGIMAPLVEELFFRGFLLRALLGSMPPWVAVVVQAVVFAGVHLQPLQFPGLLVVGLATGAVAVRTGRLGMCWAIHAGFNGLTLMSLLLT